MSTTAQLGDSGIVLNGPVGVDGVKWSWTGDSPWSPSPQPRQVTGENVTDHGSWDATRFYGPRTYTLTGYVQCRDHQTLHALKPRLDAAVGLPGFDMRVVEPGFDRFAWFRVDGELSWNEINPLYAVFSVQIWARDPRGYSTALRTASTAFPSSSGGLVWPATWPATWSGVSTTGEMSLSNVGNVTAWPVFRIDGPVTNPTIVDVESGRAMRFDIDLLAGQWLTVDTRTHQVLADGDPNASRRAVFWGDWFGIPRNGETAVRFGGDFAGPGAGLSASWRHSWI